jgi:hypothetical protein
MSRVELESCLRILRAHRHVRRTCLDTRRSIAMVLAALRGMK